MKANMQDPLQERTIIPRRRPKKERQPSPVIQLDDYRFARRYDPDTSKEAAAALAPKVGGLVHAVLTFLEENDRPRGWIGTEVEEVFARGKQAGKCPWHRLSDCKKPGWVDPVLDRKGRHVRRLGPRPGDGNGYAWRISALGRAVLRQIEEVEHGT